jgi:hypothetical protein
MATLLFIDTNILLDFYRRVGQKDALSVLTHVDANHERIITGSQIEMEFKKNRQRVILEALEACKKPDGKTLNPPAFLSHSQAALGLKKDGKSIESRLNKLKRTTEAILSNPGRNDPVYKSCQRLFQDKTRFNLSRTNELRDEIRSLAQKRFILGYPPRKDSDTSIGDAINWEWVIRCAADSSSDVIIASRDSDYGIVGQKSVINDWLVQEFRERVGRRRKLTLTEKLTDALKAASIGVTKKEERAEDEFVQSSLSFGEALRNGLTPEMAASIASAINNTTFNLNDLFASMDLGLIARSLKDYRTLRQK